MTWYLALRHYYLTINYEFGDFMLSKCASPGCSTAFRYLHEGKLYLIDRKAASAGRKPPADLRYARKSRGLEYVWLCSSCCSDLTIQVDDDHGVRVVRKREGQNGSIQTGPSMQLKQRGAYVRQAQARQVTGEILHVDGGSHAGRW
jgi:hypothetical protein